MSRPLPTVASTARSPGFSTRSTHAWAWLRIGWNTVYEPLRLGAWAASTSAFIFLAPVAHTTAGSWAQ